MTAPFVIDLGLFSRTDYAALVKASAGRDLDRGFAGGFVAGANRCREPWIGGVLQAVANLVVLVARLRRVNQWALVRSR